MVLTVEHFLTGIKGIKGILIKPKAQSPKLKAQGPKAKGKVISGIWNVESGIKLFSIPFIPFIPVQID